MDEFAQCTSLETINIPDTVTNIGPEAFKGTVWLKNRQKENPIVTVNGILVDGTNCSGDVVIPDTVKSIAGCAFIDCDDIKTVIIPSSVESIDYKAFQFCRNLDSVTIMNPDCKINGDETVIYNGNGYKGVIIGYNGSTAEEYANKYNYKFESLGDYSATAAPTSSTTTTSTTTNTTTTKTAATTTVPTLTVTKEGDANCDNSVDMSDVVLIMQALANPNKYGINGTDTKHITEQGWINSDVDKSANGITANDALRIQEFLLGKIKQLTMNK